MRTTKRAKKMTIVKGELPSGVKFQATLPETMDKELVRIAILSILGSFAGIQKVEDEKMRRTFMIRFVASILAEVSAAVHSAQMSNKLGDKNPTTIVENLLKSLHKEKPKDKK